MSNGPLPIGSLHDRDFALVRQQAPLRNLMAGPDGYVRLACSRCERTGEVKLAELLARFNPDAGLNNVLHKLMPKDCPATSPDPWGIKRCGFHYRDLR